jgi:hypothetical protein
MRNSIRSSSLRGRKGREEINPMDGIANLADAMLVLACGLMMALILHWNVDINLEQVDISTGSEVTNVEDLQESMVQIQSDEDSYQRMGILYQDPQTGKMYMLTEEPTESTEKRPVSNDILQE